jgi:hypothetical protein
VSVHVFRMPRHRPPAAMCYNKPPPGQAAALQGLDSTACMVLPLPGMESARASAAGVHPVIAWRLQLLLVFTPGPASCT